MSEWRDVDDGQAAMSEENAAWTIYPRTCVVRPAMGEAREHAFHPLLGGVESGWVPEA